MLTPKRHTLAHLLDELEYCSISAALVGSTLTETYDPLLENYRLSEQLAPYDHLFPLWAVFPHHTGEMPRPTELTALLNEHDLRAVRLLPRAHDWRLQSRSSHPLLDELASSQRLVIVDMDQLAGYDDLEYLLINWPHLPILLRGQSWRNQRTLIPLLLEHKQLHIGFDTFQIHHGPEWLCELGCDDQCVFVSNAPAMSAGAHRAYIDWADIPHESRANFAGGNLSRLLKGLSPPRNVVNASEDELMTACRQGKPLPTLCLDLHAHILDEGSHGAGSVVMQNGGPNSIRKQNERLGVAGIGLMSWNGPACTDWERGNHCVTAALDAHPDYYWGLATFDSRYYNADELHQQMEEAFADPRMLGLKPYPRFGIAYDDPRYDPWWSFGNKRGLYALIHPTKWGSTDEHESMCRRFPHLTVLAAHAGGDWDYADKLVALGREYSNLIVEPTLTTVHGGIIEHLVEGLGADRVMYGSDLPMRDPRQQLGWCVFARLDLPTKKKILGLNTQALITRIRDSRNRHGAVATGVADTPPGQSR